jgi:hypothetical protein
MINSDHEALRSGVEEVKSVVNEILSDRRTESRQIVATKPDPSYYDCIEEENRLSLQKAVMDELMLDSVIEFHSEEETHPKGIILSFGKERLLITVQPQNP